jgi:hypothetical protein
MLLQSVNRAVSSSASVWCGVKLRRLKRRLSGGGATEATLRSLQQGTRTRKTNDQESTSATGSVVLFLFA